MVLPERGKQPLLLEFSIRAPQVNAAILGAGEDEIGVGGETGTDLGGNVFVALVLVNDIFVAEAVHSYPRII